MESSVSGIEMEKIVLDRVQMALWKAMSERKVFLQDASVRARLLSDVADEFVFTLSGWMFGNKFPDRSEFAEFSYPAGWWQMFKSQHAPNKYLLRWVRQNYKVA